MNTDNLTPEQIMDRDARENWERAKAPFLADCFHMLTEAGTSAEAFHKFDVLTDLLDMVRDPDYADAADEAADNPEAQTPVVIADIIREYLNESWKDHKEGRLQVLRDRQQ